MAHDILLIFQDETDKVVVLHVTAEKSDHLFSGIESIIPWRPGKYINKKVDALVHMFFRHL